MSIETVIGLFLVSGVLNKKEAENAFRFGILPDDIMKRLHLADAINKTKMN